VAPVALVVIVIDVIKEQEAGEKDVTAVAALLVPDAQPLRFSDHFVPVRVGLSVKITRISHGPDLSGKPSLNHPGFSKVFEGPDSGP